MALTSFKSFCHSFVSSYFPASIPHCSLGLPFGHLLLGLDRCFSTFFQSRHPLKL
ncbi:unnamed protein product [Staurois parvus]|uniref:Uncharacterized protein n=1 Tax=Staurois parvus TaxID=386267 RepID=A0ABN9HBV6_9NEOB|nr:unnamed protein product [Staurois parvus]